MKTYRYTDAPLEVHGLPFFAENGKLERLPEEVREKVPSLAFLGRRSAGARICFRTDSPRFTVKMELETNTPDLAMGLFCAQSAHVMVGDRKNPTYAGLVGPKTYEEMVCEATFEKSAEMEEVTVWLPRNEVIADITVSVEDGARVEAPTPYTYPPILYYGSSITEGGCTSRVTNNYVAIISRHLDVDFYNFGFSGCAMGEPEMAECIRDIPMCIFVYDYDHNAPTPEHLEKTHEPFFKMIRETCPDLPVVMMTKPDFDYDKNAPRRREIVRRTYENARAAGDENVYFVDGETFFGDIDREFCTVDRCHPNDLGAAGMARAVEPVIAKILQEKFG